MVECLAIQELAPLAIVAIFGCAAFVLIAVMSVLDVRNIAARRAADVRKRGAFPRPDVSI